MIVPPVINPRLLLRSAPAGSVLDGERTNICLCGKTAKLKNVQLVWLDFGDGFGYRAVCNQSCFVGHVTLGGA